jgi:hypothetical protein
MVPSRCLEKTLRVILRGFGLNNDQGMFSQSKIDKARLSANGKSRSYSEGCSQFQLMLDAGPGGVHVLEMHYNANTPMNFLATLETHYDGNFAAYPAKRVGRHIRVDGFLKY